MSVKSEYKYRKATVMGAFNANPNLRKSISNAYDKATEQQQQLMFLCASIPAEKVETALHVLGNLISGNDIVQVSNEIYGDIQNAVRETTVNLAKEKITEHLSRNNINSRDKLHYAFVQKVYFVLSNGKEIVAQFNANENALCVFHNEEKILDFVIN